MFTKPTLACTRALHWPVPVPNAGLYPCPTLACTRAQHWPVCTLAQYFININPLPALTY